MDLLLTGLLMSPVALIVILIVALLIFGKRLPEVAKSLGKGIVEFKKGVKGIEDEVERPLPPPNQYPQNQYPQNQYPQNVPGQQQYGQYGAPPAYQPPSYQNPPYQPAPAPTPASAPDQQQPYGAPTPQEQRPV